MTDAEGLNEPARGLSSYDYVRTLNVADLAWEYLRRNAVYQRAWRLSAPSRPKAIHLMDGTRLVRPRLRFPQAEVWGLICFR